MPSSENVENADIERRDLTPHETASSREPVPDEAAPDVFLDVPALHVDELDLEVDDLEAHVSLQAEVLDLLKLNVGADVRLGHVKLDMEGVDVQAQLKVRLHNIAVVVTRLLTTVDRNPQILEQLTRGLGTAVEDIAAGTGQAVGELGRGAGGAVSDAGRGASVAAEAVGDAAGTAVGDVGAGTEDVGRGAVEAVGDGAAEAATEGAAGGGQSGRRNEGDPTGGDDERGPARRSRSVPEGRHSEPGGAGHSDATDDPRPARRRKAASRDAERRSAPAKKAAARKPSSAKPAAKKSSSAKPAAKEAGSSAGRSSGKAVRSPAGRPRRRT